jgi:hypothetical protein
VHPSPSPRSSTEATEILQAGSFFPRQARERFTCSSSDDLDFDEKVGIQGASPSLRSDRGLSAFQRVTGQALLDGLQSATRLALRQ